MIYQLRIYEIFETNKDAFHTRFRDHAARIMKRYGFGIVAMWEAKRPEQTEFVYLLCWPDEETKTRSWKAFMADVIGPTMAAQLRASAMSEGEGWKVPPAPYVIERLSEH